MTITTADQNKTPGEAEILKEVDVLSCNNKHNFDVDWRLTSKEERTPRKFRAKEPDVVVIVGGVEFYHYEDVLCSNCDFFDNLLASQMKESNHGIIELFPDRNPAEWMEVYKFLDPMNFIGLQQYASSMITDDNVDMLLPWFDYLGMVKHQEQCDRILSTNILSFSTNGVAVTSIPSYDTWEQLKDFVHVPKTKQAILTAVKQSVHKIIQDIASHQEQYEDLKSYLLDEKCGDELWSYFLDSVVDLPRHMLDELDRETILSSATFRYMVSKWQRPAPAPSRRDAWKKNSMIDSDTDSDTTSNGPPARRRPRRRRVIDPSSDEESSEEESSSS